MPEPIKKSIFYPYTIQFAVDTEPNIDTTAFAFTRQGVFLNGTVQTALKEADILELQERMIELLEEGEASDFVATFAVGGVFPLNFMARGLEKLKTPMSPEKYHLFAGLNWSIDSFDPKEALLTWLDSLPSGSQVVLFDTGNDGNAGGQLFNLIENHYKTGDPSASLTVHIRIIATKKAKGDKSETVISKNGKEATIDLKFLWVTDNPFEDAVHFIGYDSLRSAGKMKAQKFSGGIVVQFPTHENALVGADVSAAFMDLFLGRLKLLKAFVPITLPAE